MYMYIRQKVFASEVADFMTKLNTHRNFQFKVLAITKCISRIFITGMQRYDISLSVGNKDDDSDRKVVLTQDAQRFAEQMGIQLFETSAKENKNVEEVRVIFIGVI